MKIAGIDASLTGTGVAIIDTDIYQPGDFTGVRTATFGVAIKNSTDEKKIERLHRIGVNIVELFVETKVSQVFIENYSFGSPYGAHQLGELGGVLRVWIYSQLNLVTRSIPVTSLRKLFIGYSGKGSKEEVARLLKKAQAPFEKDEGDAFVVANYGLMLNNLPHLSNLNSAFGDKVRAKREKTKKKKEAAKVSKGFAFE